MKKIGFIDYFLDEWHANHFPGWIKGSHLAGEFELALAWGEVDAPLLFPGGTKQTNQEWCDTHKVVLAATQEEVVEACDCLVVLAPDNPEKHEELSRLALASGKPVFIDKPFAPDLTTGQRMREWAQNHGTPFFSSSALRFSKECQQMVEKTVECPPIWLATGGGGNPRLYAIHQFEMVIAIFGREATRIRQCGTPQAPLFTIDFGEGSAASVQVIHGSPFRLSMHSADQTFQHHGAIGQSFFQEMIDAMLKFFKTQEVPFATWQTLAVSSLCDAAQEALDTDRWISVKSVL